MSQLESVLAYMCVCAHGCVCVSVHLCVHVQSWVHVCMHVCMSAYVALGGRLLACACVCVLQSSVIGNPQGHEGVCLLQTSAFLVGVLVWFRLHSALVRCGGALVRCGGALVRCGSALVRCGGACPSLQCMSAFVAEMCLNLARKLAQAHNNVRLTCAQHNLSAPVRFSPSQLPCMCGGPQAHMDGSTTTPFDGHRAMNPP